MKLFGKKISIKKVFKSKAANVVGGLVGDVLQSTPGVGAVLTVIRQLKKDGKPVTPISVVSDLKGSEWTRIVIGTAIFLPPVLAAFGVIDQEKALWLLRVFGFDISP